MRWLFTLLIAVIAVPFTHAAAPSTHGTIAFTSDDVTNNVPERYRLAPHSFEFERQLKYDLKGSEVEVFSIRFPSPIETKFAVNNTVHCEYFKPKKAGKFPAVVVLDILDGAGVVSRGEAMWLAVHDIPALCITMPFYGPRRPPESQNGKQRLLSTDTTRSIDNVRQVVLDSRRAVAWLAAQPEVDADKIGVVGTSLGSFMGGLLAAAEPRVSVACLLLGGGGLVDSFADHPQAGLVFRAMQLVGISRDGLKKLIAPVDPLTFADQLKLKRLLFIAASRDDVVPPIAMKRLWEATGHPKIVWLDSTHVGAAFYAFTAMNAVIEHLKR